MKFNNKTLQGLKRRQMLMYVMLFSLLTIIIWAITSLLYSQKKVPIPNELLRLAQPLNPNIDIETIQKLENKNSYPDLESRDFPIYTVVTDRQTRESTLITIDKAQALEAEKLAAQEKIRLERLATPSPTPNLGIIPAADLESEPIASSSAI